MDRFDYLVLGGGSAGMASARRAAAHGARVVVIEKGRLGGTCVNVGCVPKKIMFNAASIAEVLQYAPDYGFNLSLEHFSWAQLKQHRDAFVRRLNEIYARNLTTSGVTLVSGSARFVEPHVLEVGERRLTAPHVLIATGSHPLRPAIPGAELGITSDDFFALEERPKRIVIAGSGYIAVELAGVLHALGTEVTLLCRYDRPLRHFDELLGGVLCQELRAAGLRVETRAIVARVDRDAAGVAVTLADGRQIGGCDALLWAIGRDPVIAGFGLEGLGLDLGGGKIQVDEYQNTSLAGHYAAGDVTARVCLTPVAIAAGRRLADRLFAGMPESKLDYRDVASVIFSHPPIGTVGVSEHEAVERHGASAVKVYESRFTNLFYALGDKRRPTFVKVVTVLPRETVVGIHVIGLGADELIQGFAVALKLGATKADLDRTVAIHPTAAEELLTLSQSRMGKSEVAASEA